MRPHHSKKRPRAHDATRDRRTSPYSLLSKLPISESLDDRHVPSTGITRRQQRKLDRKNKRKRKSNSFRATHDESDRATGTRNANPPSVSSGSKLQQSKDAELGDKLPRKRRKSNPVTASHVVEAPVEKPTVHTSDRGRRKQSTTKPDALSADHDPESREIRRLERLLGIRKRNASSTSTSRYDAIFGDTETDLLDLVKSCDQTINRNVRAVRNDLADDESIVAEEERGQQSEHEIVSDHSSVASFPAAEDEGMSESKRSDAEMSATSSDEMDEKVPYVAKWKRVASNRQAPRIDPPPRFSINALQGLLNRVSASNTAEIAKRIASLYPDEVSDAEQEELTSSYADAVLEAINQGNTMGITNPYLRPHVVVVVTLGTTVDMGFLAKFVTTATKRLHDCLDSDIGPTISESALHMSHIFGYLVALCALYEMGVLSSGFMYETLLLVAEPLCKTRLDAQLKFLHEVGPLLRKNDPIVFAEMVKFIHRQKNQEGAGDDAKSASSELSFKLSMLADTVENIRNNRIKVMKSVSQSTDNSSEYLPFQASLTQLLDDDFTSTRWWDGTKQKIATKESPHGGYRRTHEEEDRDTSRNSKLAAALRLHTDTRRGLLTAVINSVSCPDAIQRIDRLGTFTSKQKLKDLTYIITHCCGAEQPYNKFYALLANRVCQKSREARFAMEFTIQDAIKRTDCYDKEEGLGRKAKTLAWYLGDLWASEGLPLSMLRRIPDLEDISSGEQNFYTASFERMICQRRAASVDPSAPFTRLRQEAVAGGNLFCSSLAVFLRRHVHPNMSGKIQPVISKAIIELERKT